MELMQSSLSNQCYFSEKNSAISSLLLLMCNQHDWNTFGRISVNNLCWLCLPSWKWLCLIIKRCIVFYQRTYIIRSGSERNVSSSYPGLGWLYVFFYQRPVLATGYCHCLCVCVCVCVFVRLCVIVSVCQPLACLRHNSSPIQARITKFGSEVQWSSPSRSNWTLTSKFTSFWVCLHNDSPIPARITKFGPEI